MLFIRCDTGEYEDNGDTGTSISASLESEISKLRSTVKKIYIDGQCIN